jgi:hypothetical protein
LTISHGFSPLGCARRVGVGTASGRRRPWALALLFAAVPEGGVAAQSSPSIPPAEICARPAAGAPGESIVDPLQLIRWLLAKGEISDATLDANWDGDTLLSEKQRALIDPDFCSARPGRPCPADDVLALEALRERLAALVREEGASSFRLQRLRRPAPGERLGVLDPSFEVAGQAFQVGEVLDSSGRYVRVLCADTSQLVAATARPPELVQEAPVQVQDAAEATNWRLTGEVDDLTKSRADLRGVRPAEFSISSDLKENQTIYQVKTVTGYDFEFAWGQRLQTSFIPLLQYDRFSDGSNDVTNKLGGGAQIAVRGGTPLIGTHEFAATPLYLTDSDFDLSMEALKMRWTPTLAESAAVPLGTSRRVGPLALRFDVDALSEVGHVGNPGGSTELEEKPNYFRVGGRLSFRVGGAPDTIIERIEFDLSDKYFYDFAPGVNNLNRLDVSLSYLLPESENYRVSLAYSLGRADDTLQEIELWKTQLGVRF